MVEILSNVSGSARPVGKPFHALNKTQNATNKRVEKSKVCVQESSELHSLSIALRVKVHKGVCASEFP